MSVMEIFQVIKVKNRIIHSGLVLSLISVTAWMTISVLLKRKNRKNDDGQHYTNDKLIPIPLVVITGCDTGLGYSIVMKYLKDDHYTTCQSSYSYVYNLLKVNRKKLKIPSKIAIIAFCLNPNGPGAKCLIELSLENRKIQLFVKQLDLTNSDSIKNGVMFITDLLQQNVDQNGKPNETGCFKYELHALINNAARMVMAEYEWQTIQIIQQQFEINVLGPSLLTAQLMPKLRKDKSRVINIISQCAHLPLPGVSVYGATKAALHAWTIALRVELEVHGVKMITFLPGSFYLHSAIMNCQLRTIAYNEMREHMNEEQLAYYGAYFEAYQNYLSSIDAYISCPEIAIPSTNMIYSEMDNALWSTKPKAEYSVPVPLRYKIYYVSAWLLSVFGLHNYKDKIVRRFVSTPKFQNYVLNQENTRQTL